MKHIHLQLLKELESQRRLALATIVETRGSTPQVVGASALFSADGLLFGTLGGGILEADALKRGVDSLQRQRSTLYQFTLSADMASEEGAMCGGDVTILIDATPERSRAEYARVRESLSGRHKGVLTTFITVRADDEVSLTRQWFEEGEHRADASLTNSIFLGEQIEASLTQYRALFAEDESSPQGEKRFIFCDPVYPLPQLLIAGAGHVGRAVAHLGQLLDFEVTVIDERPQYANKRQIPDADHCIVGEYRSLFEKISLKEDTYIVIVTPGHQHDAEALRACIDSNAAYIGMIGSVRKTQLMRQKFLEEGWATASQFDGVYAPIGIDIHSKTVQEIAVSIAAQLVLVRNQRQHKVAPWSGP